MELDGYQGARIMVIVYRCYDLETFGEMNYFFLGVERRIVLVASYLTQVRQVHFTKVLLLKKEG